MTREFWLNANLINSPLLSCGARVFLRRKAASLRRKLWAISQWMIYARRSEMPCYAYRVFVVFLASPYPASLQPKDRIISIVWKIYASTELEVVLDRSLSRNIKTAFCYSAFGAEKNFLWKVCFCCFGQINWNGHRKKGKSPSGRRKHKEKVKKSGLNCSRTARLRRTIDMRIEL